MLGKTDPLKLAKYWIARHAPLDAVIPTLEDTYVLIFGHGKHKIENVAVEIGDEILKDIQTPIREG